MPAALAVRFLHGIDHELVGLSSQAAREGLGVYAAFISAIAEVAAASKPVPGLVLAVRISVLVEVVIVELFAASAAEQILRPGWLFAIFAYFVREARGGCTLEGTSHISPKYVLLLHIILSDEQPNRGVPPEVVMPKRDG